MFQETKPKQQRQGKLAKSKSSLSKEDDIAEVQEEAEDLEITTNNGLISNIQMACEKFACNRVGQKLYEQVDRVLKVVEDTARWGLPQDENDMKLERPLPWVLFLSLIIWLRVLYFWLNIPRTILGLPRLSPQSAVYSIQVSRRHLRAIRLRGLKAMQKPEETSMSDSSAKNPSLMSKVRQLFGSAVCRPGQRSDTPARRVFAQTDNDENKKSNNETDGGSNKRARDDDTADLNLTVDQMLNKYANYDSEDDSDYVPSNEKDDEESPSTSSISSDDETEKESLAKLDKSTESASRPSESLDQTVLLVEENGGPKGHSSMPKPMDNVKLEPNSDADSGNEHLKTPESSEKFENHHMEMHNTEDEKCYTSFQQQSTMHKTDTIPIDDVKQHKATTGHKSGASILNSTSSETPKTDPSKTEPQKIPQSRSKSSKTITTETCIEYDWKVVVKTEITHRRQPIQMNKMDCSVQTLTPASSTEDVFYSPIGSPQHLHSIFHPAPEINVYPPEDESCQTATLEMQDLSQRKPIRPIPIKPQQYKHNFHNKYRNKNRN